MCNITMGTACSTPISTQTREATGSLSVTNGSIRISIGNKTSKSKSKLSSIFNESESSVSDYNEESDGNFVYYPNGSPPELSIRPPTNSIEQSEIVVSPLKIITQYGKIKIPSISEFSPEFREMVTGQLSDNIQSEQIEKREIYIYHLAEFSDSQKEKNTLQENVYNKLRSYCMKSDVTLQVIDLSWNLKDYSANGHACRRLSKTILQNLISKEKQNSIFTVFLNEKYGIYWCPLEIEKDVFEEILKKSIENDKQFLFETYSFDDSLQTPAYVLQPVENHTPKYKESGSDFQAGLNEIQKQHIRLKNILSYASPPELQKDKFFSDLERDLQEFLLQESNSSIHTNTICLRRTFANLVWEEVLVSSKYAELYKSVNCNQINETAEYKQEVLTERVLNIIEPSKLISHNIVWSPKGIDPELVEHDKYLDHLSSKYYDVVLGMVDEMLLKFKKQKSVITKMISRGTTHSLCTDMMHQTRYVLDMQNKVLGYNTFMSGIEEFIRIDGLINENKSKLLVLHGPVGSGKSSIATVMANNVYGVDGWKNCCCIFKSAGVSRESLTLEHMIYNLAEQLCILSDVPISKVYQHKANNILHYLLNATSPRIPGHQPILIILDGLDQVELDGLYEYESLNWLPKEYPKSVRVCVTVTSESDMCLALQKHVPSALYMEVPKLTPIESLAILSKKMITFNMFLSPQKQQEIEPIINNEPTPMFLVLLALILKLQSVLVKNVVYNEDTTMEELFNQLLALLEQCYGKHYVALVCLLMTLSRYGISFNEILESLSDKVSEDVPSVQRLYNEILIPGCYVVRQIPSVQLYAIIDTLSPLLIQLVCHGVILYKWRHVILRQIVLKRYIAYKNDSINILYLYFRKCSMKINQSRILDELPYSIYNHGLDISGLFKLIINKDFIASKINKCGIHHMIRDIYLILTKNNHSGLATAAETLNMLLNLRKLLVISPSAFTSHLQNYLLYNKNNKSITGMYSNGNMDQDNTLHHCLGTKKFGFGYVTDEIGNYTYSSLHRIPGNSHHVITLSTTNDEIRVMNIHTGEAQRILRGINKPRDLRVIDKFKAVILCDRELRIYDLDKGLHLSTLKGVLNLKIPFFGVHDRDHTMAVSRNRMYVNMFNNSSGDVSATFKIGEDRFLNSLLVSENGEICVCGDDVQKPSPLLVWDLNHRKLIHDLRINGHEFLTKIAALSKDGKYVVCASKEIEYPDPNFLLVYDLQNGSMFTKLKPDFSCTAVALSARAVMSAHENGDVIVWDLDDSVGNTQKYILEGHVIGPNCIYLNEYGTHGITFDSTGRETDVRMWNFEKGQFLGCVQSCLSPSCCQISADGNTVIICYPGDRNIFTFHAKDIVFNETVKYTVYGDASRKGKVAYLGGSTDESG